MNARISPCGASFRAASVDIEMSIPAASIGRPACWYRSRARVAAVTQSWFRSIAAAAFAKASNSSACSTIGRSAGRLSIARW